MGFFQIFLRLFQFLFYRPLGFLHDVLDEAFLSEMDYLLFVDGNRLEEASSSPVPSLDNVSEVLNFGGPWGAADFELPCFLSGFKSNAHYLPVNDFMSALDEVRSRIVKLHLLEFINLGVDVVFLIEASDDFVIGFPSSGIFCCQSFGVGPVDVLREKTVEGLLGYIYI